MLIKTLKKLVTMLVYLAVKWKFLLEKDEFMNKINFILKLIFKHTICPAVFKEDHKDMDVALVQL